MKQNNHKRLNHIEGFRDCLSLPNRASCDFSQRLRLIGKSTVFSFTHNSTSDCRKLTQIDRKPERPETHPIEVHVL